MNAIYIIHSQDGYNGLSLVVSHLIMDSFAIFAFYKFVMDYENISFMEALKKCADLSGIPLTVNIKNKLFPSYNPIPSIFP